MDWGNVIQGGLGLMDILGGLSTKGLEYENVPASAGQKQANKLIQYGLADLLKRYTGQPLSVVPTYSDLKFKYGDIMSSIPTNTGKYSGTSAYTAAASNEPTIGRAQDLRSALINRELGDAGRRMAMGFKFNRRNVKVGDFENAIQRQLQQLQNDLMAQQMRQQMMMQGLYDIGNAGAGLYDWWKANRSADVSGIDVGDLAGVLGKY